MQENSPKYDFQKSANQTAGHTFAPGQADFANSPQFRNINYDDFLKLYRVEELRLQDPVAHTNFIRSQWECHAKKLLLLFSWHGSEKSLFTLHHLLTCDVYRKITNGFSFENFKPHFIPVWGRELVPIPWIGSLNELAEVLMYLAKVEHLITVKHNVRVQIQKHFTWNGGEIDNGSIANALSTVGKTENYIKSSEIIDQIHR